MAPIADPTPARIRHHRDPTASSALAGAGRSPLEQIPAWRELVPVMDPPARA